MRGVTRVREPHFLMSDGTLIAFSLSPNDWLIECAAGKDTYIPDECPSGNSESFGREYAARLLQERGA